MPIKGKASAARLDTSLASNWFAVAYTTITLWAS